MGPSWAPVDDQVSLSWSEAGTLQFAPGIEFGSHTCSHPELPQLTSSEIDVELQDSLRAIRNNLHESVPVCFAYPYGFYSESIAGKARSAGYSCALTTDAGSNSINTDLFRLRRAVVTTRLTYSLRVSLGWSAGCEFFEISSSKHSLPSTRYEARSSLCSSGIVVPNRSETTGHCFIP
jgi:peptidoglycan/xylan/chitin deacetylase (PgdA/CDA1 family)